MSYENWKDKIGTFEVMDVRGKKMDFFPALKAKAAALKNGEGPVSYTHLAVYKRQRDLGCHSN